MPAVLQKLETERWSPRQRS